MEDPTEPDVVLEAPSFLVSAEYNNRDHNVIAGGCYNGQVRYPFDDGAVIKVIRVAMSTRCAGGTCVRAVTPRV